MLLIRRLGSSKDSCKILRLMSRFVLRFVYVIFVYQDKFQVLPERDPQMASEQLVCHIDEQFCQCAICLKPFSQPKVLPCLHRFCKECLCPLFVNLTVGDIFYCPFCRAELSVTEGGVEDIKSDFLVSELTKVIQLQKTLQSQNQIRQCVGCNKEEESAGFCSKCGGFLCKNCFNFHQTFSASMLKDHQPVIDLKDIISGKVKIGMEKLSQFTKAPRCQNHPENILRLSCVTCGGQQICIACTYEDHVEHKAESIRNMAGKYRDDLQKKLDELTLMVANWESNFAKLTTVKESVASEITGVRDRISSITEEKLEKLKAERENVTLSTEMRVSDLKKSSVLEKTRLENERNEKIKEIERQYDELLMKHDIDTNNNIEKEKETGNTKGNKIEKRMLQLKAHSEEMINVLSKQLHIQNLSIDGVMSDLSSTQKRFENFNTTGSSVLSLANDWSVVDNIASLRFAFEAIKGDVEKVKAILSELEEERNLHNLTVSESAEVAQVGVICREKHSKSVVDLDSMRDEHFIPLENVDQVVFLKSSGLIILSGNLPSDYSAAVIKTTVVGQKCEYLKHFNDCSEKKPFCLICQIDEDILAVACDKSLGTMNVKELTSHEQKMEGKGCVTNICNDQTSKQILTHQVNDNFIKVFDFNLNLVKTRRLPDALRFSCMIVHDNMLIIGGGGGGNNIYVLSGDDEILSVLSPPGLLREEGEVWECLDLCSSGDKTLYALWLKSIDSETAESSGYIVLYTPTYYPMEMIPTSSEAKCLTLMEKERTRKVITAVDGALYMYKPWHCKS